MSNPVSKHTYSFEPFTSKQQLTLMRGAITLSLRMSRYADNFESHAQLYIYFFENLYPLIKNNEKKQLILADILKYTLQEQYLDSVSQFSKITPHKLLVLQFRPDLINERVKYQKLFSQHCEVHSLILQNLIDRERFLAVFKRFSTPEVVNYLNSCSKECQALYQKVVLEDMVAKTKVLTPINNIHKI